MYPSLSALSEPVVASKSNYAELYAVDEPKPVVASAPPSATIAAVEEDVDYDYNTQQFRRDEYLNSFKVRFAKAHDGQNYDEFKSMHASHALKRYLLCGKPPTQSIASVALKTLAPTRISAHLTNIASRLKTLRMSSIETTQSEHGEEHDEGDEIDSEIRTRPFSELMLLRGRTLDDVLALEEGNLLQLYRCGVNRYDDLLALGFNPVLHLRGAKTPKTPAWQLADLYDFTFEHLVHEESKGGFAMPVRDVARFVGMLPAEWSIVGATAGKMIALGMDKTHAALLRMSLSQWEKYLRFHPAHLHALKITTREDFTQLMHWDEQSELCPR